MKNGCLLTVFYLPKFGENVSDGAEFLEQYYEVTLLAPIYR